MGIENRRLENANKITYLAKKFPKKTLPELLELFQLPQIDMNAAIWYAQDLGWISKVTDKGIKVLKTPETWQFGEFENRLEDEMVYCIGRLNAKESDIDEENLMAWVAGYASQDALIAGLRLLEDKVLATYELEDIDKDGVKSIYTFYSLYENGEQLWGQKAFKKAPKKKK